jgi:hypothetical protein
VAEFCTCGAELPPDALFCHKCGKPQREELVREPEEPPKIEVMEPAAVEPPRPPEIGFGNSLAVRVGFLAGSVGFLLFSLPFPIPVRLLFLLGAGVYSVYLYGRRSGRRVEMAGGARMGWITGLFCFLILVVLFAISYAVLSVMLRDESTASYFRTQLGNMGMSPEKIQEAMDAMRSPGDILASLLALFVTSTVTPALGGILGARFLRRN